MYTPPVNDTNDAINNENVFNLPDFTSESSNFTDHIYCQYFTYQNDIYVRFLTTSHSDKFLKVFDTQYKDVDYTLHCFPVCGHLYNDLLVDLKGYIQLFVKNMKYISNGLWKMSDNLEINIDTLVTQLKNFIDTRIVSYNEDIRISNLFTQISESDIKILPQVIINNKDKPLYLDISSCEVSEINDELKYILTTNVIIYILQFTYSNYMNGFLNDKECKNKESSKQKYQDIFTLHDTYITTEISIIELSTFTLIELINKINSLTLFPKKMIADVVKTPNSFDKISPISYNDENKITNYLSKINPLFLNNSTVMPSNYDNLYASIDSDDDLQNNILHSCRNWPATSGTNISDEVKTTSGLANRLLGNRAYGTSMLFNADNGLIRDLISERNNDIVNKNYNNKITLVTDINGNPTLLTDDIKSQISLPIPDTSRELNNMYFDKAAKELDNPIDVRKMLNEINIFCQNQHIDISTSKNIEQPKGILVNNVITKTSDIYSGHEMISSIKLLSEYTIISEIDNKYMENIGLINTVKTVYDLATSMPDFKDLVMNILKISCVAKPSTPCEFCDSKIIRQKSLIQHFIHRHKELLKENGENEEETVPVQSSLLTSEILKYLEAIRKKHPFIINKNNISTHIEECKIIKKRTCNGMCFQYNASINDWTDEIIDDVLNSPAFHKDDTNI
jgi:hypothetical protein